MPSAHENFSSKVSMGERVHTISSVSHDLQGRSRAGFNQTMLMQGPPRHMVDSAQNSQLKVNTPSQAYKMILPLERKLAQQSN